MNRRSFLALTAGAVYDRPRRRKKTRHVILIAMAGARKKDYYEDPSLASNIRRIASEGFVFEEDHCDSVSSHDAALAELLQGLAHRSVESLRSIPGAMRRFNPPFLVCREPASDAGHGAGGGPRRTTGYEEYLRAVKAADERIGAIFDWVKADPYFSNNTAIVIRPDFGRDDEINIYGELHHSEGYYYTHRVASIFWGPDFRKGVDRKTVVNRVDMAPTLAKLLNVDTADMQGRVVPGLYGREN